MTNDDSKINYLAIVLAVVAAAIVSLVWYSPFFFGHLWIQFDAANGAAVSSATIPAWKTLVELVREFVVASVLAHFVRQSRIADWRGALRLGFWAWLGFPVAMLVGASLWDNKPWMLSVIHGGDWLVKMLVMSVILATCCPAIGRPVARGSNATV
jgi:hypothetical protein